ncbi:MAG: sugar ABC transporter ATP-binding protein [Anaerolineaceae bacterium]|nr:sugar ABC transporter ATP-binding protein [Anaerolineaceae bacterium]
MCCQEISKRFGGLVAVNQVSLDIFPGEVVCIVGDNGAGKSTLVNMISGVYQPDSGKIFVSGKEVAFGSPKIARDMGIETIYQDLALATNLNAADNIFLGREPLRKVMGVFDVLDRDLMRKESELVLNELDIVIPGLLRPIREFSGGQRQAVAISRSVYWKAKLLIMDEPTAALGVPEQRKVYDLVRKLRERNVPVIVISHNMRDVFSVADRIIVMLRGRKVADLRAHETDEDEVLSYIIGKNSLIKE